MGRYVDDYIEYYAPDEIRPDYYRLRELTDEIKELEVRLAFAKRTYSGFAYIQDSLDKAKDAYSILHHAIVKAKTGLKATCGWERRRGPLGK